jgi:probable HAF family extracellular repeat protein
MAYLRRFTFSLLLLLCVPLIHAQSNSVVPNANLTFTTINVPGAGVTNVLAINSAGDMVGNYAAAINTPSSGFLFSGEKFTLFDYPGGDSTIAHGINDSGLISGWAYIRQGSAANGFLYDGTTFTTIRVPGKSATLAWGINNAGNVVGGTGTLSATVGFELIGGRFKKVSPPGDYLYVYATGINNLGGIVGWTFGGVGSNNGFAYKAGKFKTIRVPGASQTEALGINDSGIIVGWYASASFTGFALMGGKYIKISYPGAIYTFASGINNSGQIVGSYTFDQQTYHGFVTSPITTADFE